MEDEDISYYPVDTVSSCIDNIISEIKQVGNAADSFIFINEDGCILCDDYHDGTFAIEIPADKKNWAYVETFYHESLNGYWERIELNEFGYVKTIIDSEGNASYYKHDDLGRPIKKFESTSRYKNDLVETWEYDGDISIKTDIPGDEIRIFNENDSYSEGDWVEMSDSDLVHYYETYIR